MANGPRRHHYTPVFYLKNLIDPQGQLHVISRQDGHRFCGVPEAIGFEKDCYTIDDAGEGEDPHAIEKAYSRAHTRIVWTRWSRSPEEQETHLAGARGSRRDHVGLSWMCAGSATGGGLGRWRILPAFAGQVARQDEARSRYRRAKSGGGGS